MHKRAHTHTHWKKIIVPLWCTVSRLGLCELLMCGCVFVCGLYFAYGLAALSNQPKYMTSSSCNALTTTSSFFSSPLLMSYHFSSPPSPPPSLPHSAFSFHSPSSFNLLFPCLSLSNWPCIFLAVSLYTITVELVICVCLVSVITQDTVYKAGTTNYDFYYEITSWRFM